MRDETATPPVTRGTTGGRWSLCWCTPGCAGGEAPALRWFDIDLAEGRLRDRGTLAECRDACWSPAHDREDPASGAAELRQLRRRTELLEQENEILRRATAYFGRDVLP